MTEQDKQIQSRLHEVFPDPHTARRVVDLVVHNRPLGWSRKSNAPYYKAVYAKQIQEDIDKMIETGHPRVFRYATWCNEDTGMSHNTLYNRVNQSIRYLIEQMDTPDHKYAKWYESVRIERLKDVGITISFIAGMGTGPSFKGEEMQPREHMPPWEQRMDKWLESGNITPFCEENLVLTKEEAEKLQIELDRLSGIQASVTCRSIKIVRVGE